MGKVIWSPASSATVWSRRLTGPTVMVASSGSVGRTVNLHSASTGVHRACFRRSPLRSHSPWAQTAERSSLLILCSVPRIAHQLASARGLFLFRLAEALEEPHAAPVRVQGIDVVDHDELVLVLVELGVHAKGGGVALDPAGALAEHRPDRAALGEPAGADQDQEVEVPLSEGLQVLAKPREGREPEHLLGMLSPGPPPRPLAAAALRGRGGGRLRI